MDRSRKITSPDGLLQLAVLREANDIIVGFIGFEWHTHGDLLSAEYERRGEGILSQDAAVERFIGEVVSGRWPIVVSRVQGAIQGVWVSADVQSEFKYQRPGDVLEVRRWDGKAWPS
ncbi:MAG: hypothetical protein JO329_25655 [Planctomycetaceae bacterium]|nr:hypothetical protein [Planctomycetaceae bacterium]MBV8557123.1 hypothetical protein [Planctomycetaceae bacterium]